MVLVLILTLSHPLLSTLTQEETRLRSPGLISPKTTQILENHPAKNQKRQQQTTLPRMTARWHFEQRIKYLCGYRCSWPLFSTRKWCQSTHKSWWRISPCVNTVRLVLPAVVRGNNSSCYAAILPSLELCNNMELCFILLGKWQLWPELRWEWHVYGSFLPAPTYLDNKWGGYWARRTCCQSGSDDQDTCGDSSKFSWCRSGELIVNTLPLKLAAIQVFFSSKLFGPHLLGRTQGILR